MTEQAEIYMRAHLTWVLRPLIKQEGWGGKRSSTGASARNQVLRLGKRKANDIEFE